MKLFEGPHPGFLWVCYGLYKSLIRVIYKGLFNALPGFCLGARGATNFAKGLQGRRWVLVSPKGPCTHTVDTLALKYSLCKYIGPKVYTISIPCWV